MKKLDFLKKYERWDLVLHKKSQVFEGTWSSLFDENNLLGGFHDDFDFQNEDMDLILAHNVNIL